jgi:hypothetical protein
LRRGDQGEACLVLALTSPAVGGSGLDHRQTAARLSTLAAVAQHLDPPPGRPRQPDIVRECLGWGAFATVVVPAVLIVTGAEITTAVLGAGVVAAVTASIFVVVRMTRLSLPRLGTSEAVDTVVAPPEPQEPTWAPDPVEAEQFYRAPEQPLPPVPAGQTWPEPWHEPGETHWNDEYTWVPEGPPPRWERTEYDTAASVQQPGEMPPQPPWLPSAEPLPWEHERGFTEVYHPPEPWLLPEPRVDQSELHHAEQRGRHRRGP